MLPVPCAGLRLLSVLLLLSQSLQAKTYVFVGSYQSANRNGVCWYALDTATGRLSRVTAVSGISNPSYITLAPDGQYLYACTESRTPGTGSVTGYRIDTARHTLTKLGSRPSGGENPVYLRTDAQGKWLVNANYTEASVSVYPLQEGRIGPVRQLLRFTDSSVDPERQRQAHLHAVVFSPDQRYVLVPDLGSDKIRILPFDANRAFPIDTAALSFVRVAPGSGPRQLIFSPSGTHAYLVNEMNGTVDAFRYNDGSFQPIQRLNAHPDSVVLEYNSADIQVAPDGAFLYTSNRGEENNIAIYSVAKDGLLRPIGYEPVRGNHPRSFAISPCGRFLIVANQMSNNITVFRRDLRTGLLRCVSSNTRMPGASCVKIREYP